MIEWLIEVHEPGVRIPQTMAIALRSPGAKQRYHPCRVLGKSGRFIQYSNTMRG